MPGKKYFWTWKINIKTSTYFYDSSSSLTDYIWISAKASFREQLNIIPGVSHNQVTETVKKQLQYWRRRRVVRNINENLIQKLSSSG